MKREFIYTETFDKKWDDLGLDFDALTALEQFLMANPTSGSVMRNTGGIRKLKWALPKKGKSGGIRILYVDFIFQEKIIVFDLFTKDEKDNLTPTEKSELKDIVKAIGKELK